MSRRVTAGAGGLFLVVAMLLAGAPGADALALPARRVVIVSVPALTWRDLQRDQPPVLLDLAKRGAVASLSLRTVGTTTNAAEAYLTIGAGTRAVAPRAVSSGGAVLPPDATVGGDLAGAVAARRAGTSPGGAVAVSPDIAEIRSANTRNHYKARPGLLADQLARSGRTVAAIGDSDSELMPDAAASHLDVGLAAMDSLGRVAHGAVGPQLLRRDEQAAEGVRLDPDAVERAFTNASDDDVVVVELSDILRATRFTSVALWDAAMAARRQAILDTDALLGRLLTHIDLEKDLVFVVAPVSPVVRGSDQLTVALLAGRGVSPGLLQSGTTRRGGYVTLPDIAPTVLRSFDLEVPTTMSGAPMSSDARGAPGASTVRDLVIGNKDALFRNRATGPLTVALIAVQIVSYGAAILVLSQGRRRWHRALMAISLMTTAIPLVAYLSGLTPYRVLGVPGYIAAVFAGAGLLAALALGAAEIAARRGVMRAHLVAPLMIAGLTVATLVVDVLHGAALQINTPFGYGGGPLVAGRFSGYGNLSTGLLAQSLLVGITAWWGIRRRDTDSDRADRVLLVAMSTLFAGAVVAIGAPQFGQDVGGVLSVLPAFVLITLIAAGVTLTWRRIALTGVATFAVLALFGAIDLLRPPEHRTHLGRLFSLVADQGPSGLLDVVERKLQSNLHMLTTSVWAVLVPASIGFVVYLARGRMAMLPSIERATPGLRLFLVGTATLTFLSMALNDSGIAIPAFMLVMAMPYLSYVALSSSATRPTR